MTDYTSFSLMMNKQKEIITVGLSKLLNIKKKGKQC